MTLSVFLVMALLVAFVIAGITVWLIRRLWGTGTAASKAVGIVVVSLTMFGVGGTLVGVVKAFRAISGESVDPSQKARILAEGISEAMNCLAFSSAVAIPSVIVALVITRKRRSAPTPE